MSRFNAKRIADPVHGTIGLSDLELEVISTSAFQRLRNVKQLGLAYHVFPGADYSRFAHSLGVCHVTGRIMMALQDIPDSNITEAEAQLYRLAALLHDVGHYPYSHAMEIAIENHFDANLFVSNTEQQNQSDTTDEPISSQSPFYKHESLGKEILKTDKELLHVFNQYKISPQEVYSIFLREQPPRLANLVSSDLDADRIDYLLRTAHHTGLPYGTVDLDYLLSQVRIDNEKRVCLTEKALRTADHFLLSRYFDYQQVAFHKTVASLELVLKDVLAALLSRGLVDCSASGIAAMLKDGTWTSFDDALILEKIRALYNDSATDAIVKAKSFALLQRRPPKLVAEKEAIQSRTDRGHLGEKQSVREHCDKWAAKFGIDRNLWYIWDASVTLTKIGSRIPFSTIDEVQTGDKDKLQQAIRIQDRGKNTSQPIFDLPYSLMHVLSEYSLNSLRVYVLLPADKEQERSKISQEIKNDLQYIGWK